jgi:hypothetical protein
MPARVWRRRPWPTATPRWTLGVEVVPVLNKMDLPNADPDNAKREIEDVIGIDADRRDCLLGQDRHGHRRHPGSHRRRMPAPKGNPEAPLARDDHRQLVRQLRRRGDAGAGGGWPLAKGERIKMMATGHTYNADSLGVFTPANQPRESLEAGEVGYIIAGIKELQAAKVGDTITLIKEGTNGARLHGHRAAARLQGNPAAGVCRPVPDRGQPVRGPARQPGKAQAQRLHRCTTSPRCRRRWALASAAASWACCTWRSCRSAWSASSTRT